MQAATKVEARDHATSEGDEEIFEIDPIFDGDIPDLASPRGLAIVQDGDGAADPLAEVLARAVDLKVRLQVAVPAANDSGAELGDDVERPDPDHLSAKRVMWGRLEELGLADVIQALAANRSSGRLAVRTELGEGEIFFAHGVLASVKMGGLSGIPALARLLAALEGDFEVRALPVVHTGAILGEAAPILLEAMRQLDEAKRLCDDLPGTSHVLVVREGADFAALEPDDAAFLVAELFFEPTSVARARRLDALGDQRFFAGLLHLWQSGLIRDTGRREIMSRQTALPMDVVSPLPPLRERLAGANLQSERTIAPLSSKLVSREMAASKSMGATLDEGPTVVGLHGIRLMLALASMLFVGFALGAATFAWWMDALL